MVCGNCGQSGHNKRTCPITTPKKQTPNQTIKKKIDLLSAPPVIEDGEEYGFNAKDIKKKSGVCDTTYNTEYFKQLVNKRNLIKELYQKGKAYKKHRKNFGRNDPMRRKHKKKLTIVTRLPIREITDESEIDNDEHQKTILEKAAHFDTFIKTLDL
tara:strand:+ start:1049 stop:1516 length:468 start_codon:yes stop_codon:yes gene_type:complete